VGTPSGDRADEVLVTAIVDIELLAPQAVEAPEHVREHLDVEAAVLLRRQFEQSVEAVQRLDRPEIEEVPRFGSAEQRQYLVDRKFVAAQRRRRLPGLDRKQPGIRCEIHLCSLLGVGDDKPGEARALANVLHVEPGGHKRPNHRRNEPVDGGRREAEEIEIAGRSMDLAARDQSCSAGEGEVLRFFETGDDLGYPRLERAQHYLERA
jgi:hypothetical protein